MMEKKEGRRRGTALHQKKECMGKERKEGEGGGTLSPPQWISIGKLFL
jgi:hypothetical protein